MNFHWIDLGIIALYLLANAYLGYGSWSTPEFVALFQKQRATVNQDERLKVLWEMTRINKWFIGQMKEPLVPNPRPETELLVDLARLESFEVEPDGSDRRLQLMRDCVDESVMLVMTADLPHEEDRIQDDAADDQREQHDAEEDE